MKAAVFERFGNPEEVLQAREVPIPEPARGQVRVRMRASPINPSDLLTVRGQYGRLPKLPATPGMEGMGVIDAAGPGLLRILRGLKPGRRVAVICANGGAWAEYAVVPARLVIPLPDDIADQQAASFFVNPATVVAMVQHVLRVPPGEWLLQTAAGSSLGRMVIRLGKAMGFRTINVVRRRQQVEELLKAGADAVICSSEEPIGPRVRDITGTSGVRYALDAVGGDTGAGAVQALGPGGRLLVYGTLSGEPMALDPRTLMVGQKSVEGFWLSEWAARQRILTMMRLFRTIRDLIRQGVLTCEVGATFGLEEIGKAAVQAEQPGRSGKVLLRLTDHASGGR